MEAAKKESAFSELISPVIVLVVICLVCSAILAVLNQMTAPIIEENTARATMEAYLSVMPEGTTAENLSDAAVTTSGVKGAVISTDGTVAVKAAAAGYSGNDVVIYVSFGADGKVSNMAVDASTQTTGIGSKTGDAKFYGGYIGWDSSSPVGEGDPVDTISGATISSRAVISALNSAIDCYNNELKGVA